MKRPTTKQIETAKAERVLREYEFPAEQLDGVSGRAKRILASTLTEEFLLLKTETPGSRQAIEKDVVEYIKDVLTSSSSDRRGAGTLANKLEYAGGCATRRGRSIINGLVLVLRRVAGIRPQKKCTRRQLH